MWADQKAWIGDLYAPVLDGRVDLDAYAPVLIHGDLASYHILHDHQAGHLTWIIDFGTATTFDVISAKGEYLGGAICPGIGIASEALFTHASKLPRVEIFHPPERVVGKDTIGAIQSGLIYGYAGLVEGIVERMIAELGTQVKVIATGGLAPLIQNVAEIIEAVEPNLTLEGLKIIADSL